MYLSFSYIYISHIKPSYYVTVADRAEGLLANFDTVPANRKVIIRRLFRKSSLYKKTGYIFKLHSITSCISVLNVNTFSLYLGGHFRRALDAVALKGQSTSSVYL